MTTPDASLLSEKERIELEALKALLGPEGGSDLTAFGTSAAVFDGKTWTNVPLSSLRFAAIEKETP